MGTVSTALPEEAFAKCIRKRIYQTTNLDVGATGCSEDEYDIKCSICQVASSLLKMFSRYYAFGWM